MLLMNNISVLALVMKNNDYGLVTQGIKNWKKPQAEDLDLVQDKVCHHCHRYPSSFSPLTIIEHSTKYLL